MPLSMFADSQDVYYAFDPVAELMSDLDFERADKRTVPCERWRVVDKNARVFVTDGLDIRARQLSHDECYITLDGALDMIDANHFGDKREMESVLVRCAERLFDFRNHPSYGRYVNRLRQRVRASFAVYFRVLEQYMLMRRPCADSIGGPVKELVATAQRLQTCDDHRSLITAQHSFDEASALLIGVYGR